MQVDVLIRFNTSRKLETLELEDEGYDADLGLK